MHNNGPIGLFDSGLGGLTVLQEVSEILPAESVVYFGDTAHVPYGPRSTDELIDLADRILSYLMGQGAKYIIFACNTSSALSLPVLKENYPLPMLGIIKPGAEEAARFTKNKRVGVMATEATTRSGAYSKALRELDEKIAVFSRATPLLVPLVEAEGVDPAVAFGTVRESLAPWQGSGIDTMLLGCTHYPFLAGMIAPALAPEVGLINPAGAAVRAAAKEMADLGLLAAKGNVPRRCFAVSGSPEDFRRKVRSLTGKEPGSVTKVSI